MTRWAPRGAVVYEDAQKPGTWRVRFEKYPENTEAGSGWFGGRVSLRIGWSSKAEADGVAERWTKHGELPAEVGGQR